MSPRLNPAPVPGPRPPRPTPVPAPPPQGPRFPRDPLRAHLAQQPRGLHAQLAAPLHHVHRAVGAAGLAQDLTAQEDRDLRAGGEALLVGLRRGGGGEAGERQGGRGGQNTSSLPPDLAGPLSQLQDRTSHPEEKGVSLGERAVSTDPITTVVLTSVLEQGHRRA